MSQLNLEDYNQLVINTANSYAEEHKLKTHIYKHLKTGKYYFKIDFRTSIIECTNGREDKKYVLYSDGVRLYCREKEEFSQKFELM